MSHDEQLRLLLAHARTRDAIQDKISLLCGIPTVPAGRAKRARHINDVLELLGQFPDCAGYSQNRRGKVILSLTSEPGVQDPVYFMLKPSIPDLVPEQPVAGLTRQYSIQDFRSRELRFVIEIKRVRNKQHAKSLKTELHDDIGEYKNDPLCDDLLFFVFDPQTHIESPSGLIKAIEGRHVHNGKLLNVHCVIQK